MCELFGMCANHPVEMESSLKLFARRGGETADNPDGWGVAYLREDGFRIHKEPSAAANSEQLAGLGSRLRSGLVLAHVRKAKHPLVNSVANTHPFQCSCCGRIWVFAHNGLVPDIMSADRTRLQGPCHPEGDTDSEYACHFLLENISHRFLPEHEPGSAAWFEDLAAVSELVASYGRFNFILSNGAYLIAYGHDRLHILEQRLRNSRMVQVATEPLTDDEPWQIFEPGELRVFRRGETVAQLLTKPQCFDKAC